MPTRYRSAILMIALLFTTASVTPPANASGGYHTLTTYYLGGCPGGNWEAVGTHEVFCGGGSSSSGTQAGDWRVDDWESCQVPYDTGETIYEYCSGTPYLYEGTCRCHE